MSEQAVSLEPQRMRAGQFARRLIVESGPLLVLLALMALLWITTPRFRSSTSLALLGLEAAALGIVAAGQTYVILTGGIDLSVEAMVSFSGVIAAILIAGTNIAGGQIAGGISPIVAILIALGAGLLIGLLQGVIITAFNINPFIVTLGFRSILLGVSLVITSGAGINIRKDDFLTFVTSQVPVPFGLMSITNPRTGVEEPFQIPMLLIIAVIIYAISWLILRHTKFGRHVYALGGNETAARLSGINVNWTKIMIYGISSLLAAVAGVLVMARLVSGAYQNGTNMTLNSVAAAVIGGTALTGGTGGIWGTLVGVFIIRLVEQGLVYMSVPSNAKEIVIGAIIVIAVALDVLRRGEIKWLRLRRKPTT